MNTPARPGVVLDRAPGESGCGQPHPPCGYARAMPRRLLLPLTLVALLPPAPTAEAKPGPKLTVMTRNIYLGGNIALPIPRRLARGLRGEDDAAVAAGPGDRFPGPRQAARPRGEADEAGRDRAAGGGAVAPRPGRGQGRHRDARDHGRLRLPGHTARRAGRALPARHRADRGRHRGADQPRLRRSADDARRVLVRVRKGLRIRRRLGANYAADVRGPDPDRHAELAARLDGDRPLAARPALPLRRHAPGGVRRHPARPGARARRPGRCAGRHA